MMVPSNDQLAMQILLAAGQAKQVLLTAIEQYHQGKRLELQPGHAHLLAAHRAQNQLMARLTAKRQSPDILDCHAMDTLLAVESNFDLVQALLSNPNET